MNSEEKNINPENDIEVFSLDNMSPNNTNENIFDNQESIMNANTSEVNSTSNAFMYADSPSMVEMPVEEQTPVNTFSYTEIPVIDSEGVPTVENTFMYSEAPISSEIEMAVEDVAPVEPVENAFVYTETPVALEVPVEENSAVTDSTQKQFSYTDENEVSQTVAEETQKEPISEQRNYDVQSTTDSKSNFKFMIVFAIIMLVIIFVLPYIAGYK